MRVSLRAVVAALVPGLLALAFAGCGLFKPAAPETPVGGAPLIPNYSLPESSLLYMQLGIERKDNVGQAAYLGALADTVADSRAFHAFFDPAVLQAYTGTPPSDWDLSHETTFYGPFVRLRPETYTVQWLQDDLHPDEEVDQDHRILHRHYKVYAALESGSLLIAVGFADLYFAKVSASRWAVTRWDDRVDPNYGALPQDQSSYTLGYRRLNQGG